MDDEMTALPAFRSGFHDGYAGERRKRNQGGHYLTAYKRGTEARARQDNGGEDLPQTPKHKRHHRRTV